MYKYLLFDADNTLFDFDKCEEEAFKETFSLCQIQFSEEIYEEYHVINNNLWKLLEAGGISRESLKFERFARLFLKNDIPVDCHKVACIYEKMLGEMTFEISGNFDIIKKLSESYQLFVITNGLTSVQENRFSKSRFTPFFKKIFISEKIGFSKPSKLFFDEVIKYISDFDLSHYLVIGDSLTSDIDGAIGAGIDSCWYNRYAADGNGRNITYEITEMSQLMELLN